jgi:hypothetical protein
MRAAFAIACMVSCILAEGIRECSMYGGDEADPARGNVRGITPRPRRWGQRLAEVAGYAVAGFGRPGASTGITTGAGCPPFPEVWGGALPTHETVLGVAARYYYP